MNYRFGLEVREVAEELIFDNAELHDLSAANIQYIVTDKAARKAGREIPGKATKVSGVGALLSTRSLPDTWTFVPDVLVVEVCEVYWRTMNDAQRRGLVDHLLSHFEFDGDKGTWQIAPPEFGEFEGVLERHGFWRPMKGMRDFANVVSEQLSLLPEDDDPDESTESGDDRRVTVGNPSTDENLFASSAAGGTESGV